MSSTNKSVPIKSVPINIPVSINVSKEYSANHPFTNTPPTPKHSPNTLFLLHLNRRLDNNINGVIDKR